MIVSDGDRVLQIITNLLSNAFRWTPDGGRIKLELQRRERRRPRGGRGHRPGDRAEQRERIFRAFVSRDADGTGLGLPIARELASRSAAGSSSTREVGSGCRFRLVLPVA